MLHFYILVAAYYHFLVFRDTLVFLGISIVGVGLGAALGLYTFKLHRSNAVPVLTFFVFALFFVASYAWSIDPEVTRAAVSDFAYFAVMFFMVVFSRRARQENDILNLFLVLSVINFLVALYYVIFVGGLRGGLIGVDQSIFNITSLLIGCALIAMPWTVYDAFRKQSPWRIGLAFGQPLFIILLSGSRGGLLLFPVILFMMVMQNDVVKGRRVYHVFLGTTAVLCGGTALLLVLSDVFVGLEIIERFSSALETYGLGYGAISGKAEDYKRLSMYLTLWENITPTLVGTGKSTFGLLNEWNVGFYVPSHSIFIDLYVELGLVGSLLFSWFTWQIIQRVRQMTNMPLRRTLVTSLIVAFAYGALQGIFYNLAFYIMLAAVLSLRDTGARSVKA